MGKVSIRLYFIDAVVKWGVEWRSDLFMIIYLKDVKVWLVLK